MALHSDGRHLAVGRAGGSVELWMATSNSVSSNLGWRQLGTFPGRKNVNVIKIYFWTEKQLLVASSDGSVSMLDCRTMKRTRSIDSYGGTIWDMALHRAPTKRGLKRGAGGGAGTGAGAGAGAGGSESLSSNDGSEVDSEMNSEVDSESESEDEDEGLAAAASYVALACEDGTVRTFDIGDGYLTYDKSTQRGDARLLSIASHQDGDTMCVPFI